MMAYERSKSAWDNFGKFIHQFQPETKTLIRKLERILIKLYRQNVFLLFNQTCLHERLLPNYIYIYIGIYKKNFWIDQKSSLPINFKVTFTDTNPGIKKDHTLSKQFLL